MSEFTMTARIPLKKVEFQGRKILPNRDIVEVAIASELQIAVVLCSWNDVTPYVTGKVYIFAGCEGDITSWEYGCYHRTLEGARRCFTNRSRGGMSCHLGD